MKSPLLNSLLVLLQFFIVSLTADHEMDKRRTSNVCHNTTECPKFATCDPRDFSEGQCVCNDGYFMKASGRTRECIRIADFGELCFMNEQCEFRLGKESFCNNQQCACKSNAHHIISENACFNSSYIGDYCRLKSNCVVNKSTCQQGHCQCFYGHHPSFDRKRCVKDVKLNEKCYTDDECVIEHSQCNNNICKCKSSHIPNEKAELPMECLPLATSLYQPCQQNTQCSGIPFACCGKNNTCQCVNDYHDINSVRIIKNSAPDDEHVTFQISFNFFQRCWPTVRLNGICETDENCMHIENSFCKNLRCSCDDGFEEIDGKFCSTAEKVQISCVVVLVFNLFLRLI